MITNYIDGQRALIEHEGRTYRRFGSGNGLELRWQVHFDTGDFHNLYDPERVAALEAAYQALTSRVYTIPDSVTFRRVLLTRIEAEGFSYIIRFQGRYEAFRNEEDQDARLRDIAKTEHCQPVYGKLRVGNGDNLSWFI